MESYVLTGKLNSLKKLSTCTWIMMHDFVRGKHKNCSIVGVIEILGGRNLCLGGPLTISNPVLCRVNTYVCVLYCRLASVCT